MPYGVPHSDEVRAAAVASLLAGQSLRSVARDFGIGRATIIAWRDQAGIGPTTVGPHKRGDIGERVVALLDQILATLRAQALAVDDPAWLKGYSPAEVGTLFGVLADKAIYLAATLEPADDDP